MLLEFVKNEIFSLKLQNSLANKVKKMNSKLRFMLEINNSVMVTKRLARS